QTWFHSVSMAGVASQRTSPDSMAWAMGWAVGSLNTRQSSRALVSRMTMGGRAEAGKEGIGKAGKRSGSGVDDAAAQADLAVVEHGRLPGRDRPLRRAEAQLNLPGVDPVNVAGCIGLAVACL